MANRFLAPDAGCWSALGVYLFANVLAPFIAALTLGYVLDPIAGRLQKLGMSRLVATLVILAFFIRCCWS